MLRDRISLVAGAIALLMGSAAQAVDTPDNVSPQRTFDFTYSVTIPDLQGKSHTEVWMPLPLENKQQSIAGLTVNTDAAQDIVEDTTYGNRMLRVSGSAEELSGTTIDLAFTVTRHSVKGAYIDQSNEVPEVFFRANTLVPTDGVIAERASKAAKGSHDTMATARALYDDVVVNVSYDKSGDGWGRGDAIYACSVEKGNCTDFHSLFIGMCRSKGIPARFAIGFPLPKDKDAGTIGGYHCWAEFYVEGKGWIPVDASEASKHPEWTEFFFGNLDANRVEFTRGRDVVLPGTKGLAPRNYFIYPLLVVDGNEHAGLKHEFRFANVSKAKDASTR